MVDRLEVRPAQFKVDIIVPRTMPDTVKGVRELLAMTGYLRQYVHITVRWSHPSPIISATSASLQGWRESTG